MSRIYIDKWQWEEHTRYFEDKGKSIESGMLKWIQLKWTFIKNVNISDEGSLVIITDIRTAIWFFFTPIQVRFLIIFPFICLGKKKID